MPQKLWLQCQKVKGKRHHSRGYFPWLTCDLQSLILYPLITEQPRSKWIALQYDAPPDHCWQHVSLDPSGYHTYWQTDPRPAVMWHDSSPTWLDWMIIKMWLHSGWFSVNRMDRYLDHIQEAKLNHELSEARNKLLLREASSFIHTSGINLTFGKRSQ